VRDWVASIDLVWKRWIRRINTLLYYKHRTMAKDNQKTSNENTTFDTKKPPLPRLVELAAVGEVSDLSTGHSVSGGMQGHQTPRRCCHEGATVQTHTPTPPGSSIAFAREKLAERNVIVRTFPVSFRFSPQPLVSFSFCRLLRGFVVANRLSHINLPSPLLNPR
jgi:hypothetical protein